MMERSRIYTVCLILLFFETVLSQPKLDNDSMYKSSETVLTISSIEKIVKENSLDVMDTLMKEMRKGFEDLKRELELERSRRQALEEKMDKCIREARKPEPVVDTTQQSTSNPGKEYICPTGYWNFEDHCYKFEMEPRVYDEAKEECQDQGAYLVSVNTQAEQDYLVTQIKNNYTTKQVDRYWLGMRLVNGTRVWSDGTDVNYTYWYDGEPNCMESYGCRVFMSDFINYFWEDAKRSYNIPYICEMKASSPDDTTITQSTLATVTVRADCRPNYIRFENHCYLVKKKRVNWGEAKRACQRKGAYLVSVNTQSEQNFLQRHVQNHTSSTTIDDYWIGIMIRGKTMVWTDGTPVNFTSWSDHCPSCMHTGCRAFLSEIINYQWEDAARSHKYFYICEREM